MKRRYTNIMSDNARQQQLEMMLGVQLRTHFPHCSLHPGWRSVSWLPGASLVRRILRSEREVGNQLSLLCPNDTNPSVWCLPGGREELDLCIQLSNECTPRAVVVSEPLGVPDGAKPRYVEAYAGTYLDSLQCILQSIQIPRAVPAGNRSSTSFIYLTNRRLQHCNFVVLSLKGLLCSDINMRVGPVEILGEHDSDQCFSSAPHISFPSQTRSFGNERLNVGKVDLLSLGGTCVFSSGAASSLYQLLFPNRSDLPWDPAAHSSSSASITGARSYAVINAIIFFFVNVDMRISLIHADSHVNIK